MNSTCNTYYSPLASMPTPSDFPNPQSMNPTAAILDIFFPGFSVLSGALSKYLKIDLTLYFPTLVAIGAIVFCSQYVNNWVWEFAEMHLMSTADVRIDDEMYNMVMAWISNQKFAHKSRRFVANTNLNSRFWYLWREFDSDDESSEDEVGIDFDQDNNPIVAKKGKDKKVRFTPSFGTHYFWYKKNLLIFRRREDTRQNGWGSASEREEISVSSFGRNPAILKELLDDCKSAFMKNDENRTVIYRGGLKAGTSEPNWTRCVSRVSRPFSTVVLDESVKKSLLEDMRDYLHPHTRRWYSNRGIPYRRGYLLYGPPGTGKSSLSFAIAGYFKLKIYIVSLNSPAMNEENLGTLFSELPKQCVVLLEDIDTAGLTHTRDGEKAVAGASNDESNDDENSENKPLVTTHSPNSPIKIQAPNNNNNNGRISLSALLNILDGVASQEGRILIMTTNHIEKLDEALIRPGRVDMTVKFDLANSQMISTIFRSIFATLEGDRPAKTSDATSLLRTHKKSTSRAQDELERHKREEEEAAQKRIRTEEDAKVSRLAAEFAAAIPSMIFSPAEIQGYLLKHKRRPDTAVREAAAWVEKMKKEKKKKAKEEAEAEEKKKKEEAETEKKDDEKKDADEAWSISL